jgi:hypothetical protein
VLTKLFRERKRQSLVISAFKILNLLQPQLLKLWECLYVAKGVVTPDYCRYTKGTDSENFQAFYRWLIPKLVWCPLAWEH